MAWCITTSAVDVDVDVVFMENSTIGQRMCGCLSFSFSWLKESQPAVGEDYPRRRAAQMPEPDGAAPDPGSELPAHLPGSAVAGEKGDRDARGDGRFAAR